MKNLGTEARNGVLIALGIFSAAMGIKGFLLTTHFIDGGVTGVSMLLAKLTGTPLALLVLVINLPFMIIGYRQIGARFAAKTTVAIVGLSLCLFFIEFPAVTHDKLLTAVFGGLFIGAGIGLAIRGGCVLDGTEIAALLISRKSSLLKVGDVILILNVFIFLSATFFLGVEPALYSILTYVSASKTIDFLVHGVEEYTAIMIISPMGDEIKEMLVNQLQRGVTVLRGAGGMGVRGAVSYEQAIIYCVVTRLEIGTIKQVAIEIDPAAFITTHSLNDVEGGLLKRKVLH